MWVCVASPGLDPDRDGAVLESPGDARRRVRALAVALGAVDGRPEEARSAPPRARAARRSPTQNSGVSSPSSRVPEDVAGAVEAGSCADGCCDPLASDERLGHEAREQAVLAGDLLRVGLVREVVVAAGEPLDRVEGELVLRRAPLLVERPRPRARSACRWRTSCWQHGEALVRQRGRDVGAAERGQPRVPRRGGRTRTRPASATVRPVRGRRSS